MNQVERKAARTDWRALVAQAMDNRAGGDALMDALRDLVEAIVRPHVAADHFRDACNAIYLRIWEVVYLERRVDLKLQPCQIKGYLLMIAANQLRNYVAKLPREELFGDDVPEPVVAHHSTRAHHIFQFPVLAEYERVMRGGKSLAQAHRVVARTHGLTVEAAMTRWEVAAQHFREYDKKHQNQVAL